MQFHCTESTALTKPHKNKNNNNVRTKNTNNKDNDKSDTTNSNNNSKINDYIIVLDLGSSNDEHESESESENESDDIVDMGILRRYRRDLVDLDSVTIALALKQHWLRFYRKKKIRVWISLFILFVL